MATIVTAAQLKRALGFSGEPSKAGQSPHSGKTADSAPSPERPLLFDCRFDLSQPGDGRRRYGEGHIPGAYYVSLDKDLTAPLGQHGGRHPLPEIKDMEVLFSRLGIERGRTEVVTYDDEGGCYAARLWWMLRYCGHDRVRVLDGGLAAWIAEGGGTTTDIAPAPAPAPARFTAEVREELRASAGDVSHRGPSDILFDCRAPIRFTGEEETIDPVAGHIPGAINVPWQDMLRADGRFVAVSRMADLLAVADERSILYCGSGVTACVNVLAAEHAGLGIPRLYAGGWSDWISYPDNPIATGM